MHLILPTSYRSQSSCTERLHAKSAYHGRRVHCQLGEVRGGHVNLPSLLVKLGARKK